MLHAHPTTKSQLQGGNQFAQCAVSWAFHTAKLSPFKLVPLWLGLAAAVFNPAFAANTVGLPALFSQALTHDKTYRAALAQHEANLQGKPQALSAFLPNVAVNAQLQKEDSDRSAFGQTSNSNSKPKAYSLNLRQALFQPKAWETYQQSELANQASALSVQNAKQELMLKLAQAYFDVLAAQDTLSTLGTQKQAITEQLEAAKRNFEVGTTTVTDQQEAQARFDLTIAQELGAQNQLQVAQLNLQTLIGPAVPQLAPMDPQATIAAPNPMNAESWAAKAIQGNLQTLQAELARQIANREVSKAQYGHLPTLDLTGQVLDAEQQIFDTATGRPFKVEQESTTLSLVLNVPIFAGGLTQSQVRQQKALLNKSGFDLDNARLQSARAAKAAFLGAQTGLAQINALSTAVKSSELALKANKTGYEVGVRINIDVLNAQQQLASAQQNLFRAKYDTLLNLMRLQAAVGQLDEKSLEELQPVFSK
ncbi:MAG: TolC family outer membrane protein [Limnobacter sp.]|nr:TolC family outer membrane protein [Limnobacter sp.]